MNICRVLKILLVTYERTMYTFFCCHFWSWILDWIYVFKKLEKSTLNWKAIEKSDIFMKKRYLLFKQIVCTYVTVTYAVIFEMLLTYFCEYAFNDVSFSYFSIVYWLEMSSLLLGTVSLRWKGRHKGLDLMLLGSWQFLRAHSVM